MSNDQSNRGALFAKYYLKIKALTTGDKELDRIVGIHHILEEAKEQVIIIMIDRELRGIDD